MKPKETDTQNRQTTVESGASACSEFPEMPLEAALEFAALKTLSAECVNALSPLVRQEGFAIVETRCGVLMTHGFALTEWEADQRRKAMLATVSPEFYGPMYIAPAVLNYSLPNTTEQATPPETETNERKQEP